MNNGRDLMSVYARREQRKELAAAIRDMNAVSTVLISALRKFGPDDMAVKSAKMEYGVHRERIIGLMKQLHATTLESVFSDNMEVSKQRESLETVEQLLGDELYVR